MADVLIADDDTETSELLAKFVGYWGHTPIMAGNGQEAMRSLVRHAPDVVLLDLMMPVMDGLQFLHAIRANVRWQSLPVIVMSGADVEMLERARRYDVLGVLRKGSYDARQLVDLIDLAVGRPGPDA